MPATAGRLYGPYRVVRPLGSGGMGTVLLAEDSRLGRLVALKTFSNQHADPFYAREHLQREARAAAAISHPNVAAVHDVLEVNRELVIVFEYVEGETLAHRLQRGRLPLAEGLAIGVQLADGLAAAHAQGVIHRDLKPANVMLTRDGRAKILDFGLARSAPLDTEGASGNAITEAAMFAGTPGYAAPEQWVGEPIGVAADIFALGVVLFETLSGRRPFDAPSRMLLLQQMLDESRPRVRTLNPAVPASIDALVDAALSREPAKRPATAREVATGLRAAERDLQVPTTQTAVVPVGGRRWWIVAATALVVVIGSLITSIRPQSSPPAADTPPVVAVLPLTNSTGSPANDYLAAGVADSLTTSLAALRSITVLSRSAVMSAQSRSDVTSIAKELGASYIVEGSVQQAGDLIQLRVSLVRPDQSIAWADSVQGSFANVFELQSRLAAALGRALAVQISPAERARLNEQPTSSVDALAAYYRGRALLERRDIKGNIEAAIGEFDRAVSYDPRFAIAHAARGEALWAAYLSRRDPQLAQDAITAGTTALRLDPDRPNVRYSLALTLAGSGKLNDAIEELQRALALQPNYDDARRELGNVLARSGRLDEAIAEYRKAIELRPNYWEHHSWLGISLYQAAHYQDAIEAFNRAVALQPDNAMVYQQLGSTYQAMGRDTDAVAHYERAIGIRPSPLSYLNLGAIYHRRGEFENAIAAYTEALKLRPNTASAHRNLGDSYAALGRPADARAAYREALRLTDAELAVNPRDPVNVARGAVYAAKAGDFASARTRAQQALQLGATNIQVLFRVAVVHALAKEIPPALDALERAVAAGYDRNAIAAEEDFKVLRNSPRFQALVATPTASGGSPR